MTEIATFNASPIRAKSTLLVEQALPVLFGLLGLSQALIPRATPLVLCVLALAAILRLGSGAVSTIRAPLAYIALAAFAYLLLNASLAMDPGAALQKTIALALLTAATAVTIASLRQSTLAQLRVSAILFLTGIAIGTAIVFTELLLGSPIATRLYNSLFSLGLLNDKHLTIESGQVVAVSDYRLNRNVVNLTLVVWPATLLVGSIFVSHTRRWLYASALMVLVCGAAALSVSGSAMLALVTAATAFAAARASFNFAHCAIGAVFAFVVILALPLALLPHNFGWSETTLVPERERGSVVGRFIIWNHVAAATTNRPVVGIGLDGTRKVSRAASAGSPEHRIWHPHNIFLQTWYELGAIGAALLLALGLYVLWRLSLLSAHERPFALACFASVGAVAFPAFSAWQTWLLASVLSLYLLFKLEMALVAAAADGSGGGT